MRELKKTLIGMIWVGMIVVCCFLFSYVVIFQFAARGNVLTSTLLNFVFIIVLIAWAKIEIVLHKKRQSKPQNSKRKPTVYAEVVRDVSFMSALYLYHFGVQICIAIVSAEPDFPVLGDMSDYFLSVQYGLLVLLAGDRFSQSIFKDLAKNARCEECANRANHP